MGSKVHKHWKGILIFLLPVTALYAAYFIYPLGFVIYTSFVNWNGIGSMKPVGLTNYLELLANRTFRISIRNNLIWSVALGFIQIPAAALVAMILARRPRGWRALRTIYFVPNVISWVAIAMMWSAIYNAEFGLLNTLLNSIGLEGMTHNWLGEIETALPAIIFQQIVYIGYFMIIILASLMGIPESLYEAARIDGANALQQELRITIPMSRGILATAITLAMAYGLRQFEATFLMTGGGPANSTSVLGILLYKRMSRLNYGEASATGATLIGIGVLIILIIRNTLGRHDPASEVTQ
jgi:raffinose/stachyose/melibiose transport system permease protein